MSDLVTPERSASEKQAIESVLKAIDSPAFEPPLLPVVGQQALVASRDANVSLPELGKIIEKDQVLASRFLQVANSVAYRGRMPTTSVSGALARLGLVSTREVLFFASVEPLLFKSKDYQQEMRELRDHSLATSAACAHLARFKRFSIEDATLAGLVCDLGACAVLQHVAKFSGRFSSLKKNPKSLGAVLQDTHMPAGGKISSRWNLPEQVHRVITEHHAFTGDSPLLIKLVAAADELTAMCQLGGGFDPPGTSALVMVLGDEDEGLIDSVVDGFAMRLAEVD
jgi:HD-like signal output (HDOD) protein